VEIAATQEDLRAFAREAPALAFGAHAGMGADLSPAALGRDEVRCRAEGCGYVGRCHARPSQAAGAAAPPVAAR